MKFPLPTRAQVAAVAPHPLAPGGGGARPLAPLRAVRAPVLARELAAAPPALALGRAELPLQRLREGALLARASQVPHPHPHRVQAQRLQVRSAKQAASTAYSVVTRRGCVIA